MKKAGRAPHPKKINSCVPEIEILESKAHQATLRIKISNNQIPSLLSAGMDVSGDKNVGQDKYIAIVIGENNQLNQLSSILGPLDVHMANLPRKMKEQIIKQIQNRPENISALCITMNKNQIVESIYSLRRIQKKNYPKSKIKSVFERALFQKIKSHLEKFCLTNQESLINVQFQCEGDCRPLARSNSLIAADRGDAYKIADRIAWCNLRGIRIVWVTELDLTAEIPVSMKKLLKLN